MKITYPYTLIFIIFAQYLLKIVQNEEIVFSQLAISEINFGTLELNGQEYDNISQKFYHDKINNYLYIQTTASLGFNLNYYQIYLYDITDVEQMNLITRVEIDQLINHMIVTENNQLIILTDLYVAYLNKENLKIDEIFYTNSTEVSENYSPSYGYLDEEQDILYVGTKQSSIAILDVSDIQNIQQINIILGSEENTNNINWLSLTKDSRFLILSEAQQFIRIYDVSDPLDPIYAVNQINDVFISDMALHTSENILFQASILAGLGILQYDLSIMYSTDISDFPIDSLPIKYKMPSSVQNQFINLSDDGQFYVIDNSQKGIQIVDIQDINNPKILQIIVETDKISIGAFILQRSIDQQYIFHLSQQKVQVYQKKKYEEIQDTFKVIPHIFNTHQMYSYIHTGNQITPWRIRFHNTKDIMIVVYCWDGFLLFDTTDPLNPVLLRFYNDIVNDEYPGMIDGITLHPQYDDIIIFGKSSDGVFIFDISDPYNPILVGQVDVLGDTDGVTLLNLDPNYVVTASGYQGIAIIDISDFSNPTIVGVSQQVDFTFEEVVISRDDKYAFAAGRDFGVFIYDIQIKTDIKLINYYQTGGGQGISISNLMAGNILFAADGVYGIAILNATNPYNVNMIYKIQPGGAAYRIEFNEDETFIFAAQINENQIAIINIEDLENPYVTQTFQEEDLLIWDVKLTKDQKYICGIHDFGFYMMPVSTNQFILQEAYFNGQSISVYDPLLIGQNIDIYMFNYLQPQTKKIVNVYEYYDKELQNLQSTVVFTKTRSQLSIDIKDTTGKRIYVFELRIKIYEYDFYEVSGSTDYDLAAAIYQDLKDSQYIDANKLPQGDILVFSNMKLNDDALEPYQKEVQRIVNTKIEYIPLQITVENSLTVNLLDENQTIFTYSKEITISIILDKTQAVFVQSNFDSVITSYSNSDSQIDISGFLTYVNNILSRGIKYQALNNLSLNDSKVQIVIQDDLNQKIDEVYNMSEMSFLYKNQPVVLNQDLQQQVQQQYEKGEVIIGESFEIKLKQDSFNDMDDSSLIYTLTVKSIGSKQYNTQITQPTQFDQFTINFMASELRIELNSDPQIYNKRLILILEASDGYNTVQGQMNIKFTKFTTWYIIKNVMIYMSPIVAGLGILRYLGFFYNIFCQKKYQMSPIYIQPMENFKLVIPLQYNRNLQLQKAYKKLMDFANKQKISSQSSIYDIFFYPGDRIKIHKQGLLDILKLLVDNKSIFEKDLDPDSYIFEMIVMRLFYEQLKLNKQSYFLYQGLKKYALKKGQLKKDWFLYYVKIVADQELTSQQPFPNCHIILERFYQGIIEYSNDLKQGNLQSYIDSDPDQLVNFRSNKDVEKSVTCLNDISQANSNISKDRQFTNYYKTKKLFLIKNALISRTLGVHYKKFLQYSSGITINSRQQNINQVQVFQQKGKSKNCINKIFRFLNMDWESVPMSQNQPLGEYFTTKCHRDILQIERIKPFRKEDQSFKIKIYSKFGLILQEFILIQDNEQADSDFLSEASRHLKQNQSKDNQTSGNYKTTLQKLCSRRESQADMKSQSNNIDQQSVALKKRFSINNLASVKLISKSKHIEDSQEKFGNHNSQNNVSDNINDVTNEIGNQSPNYLINLKPAHHPENIYLEEQSNDSQKENYPAISLNQVKLNKNNVQKKFALTMNKINNQKNNDENQNKQYSDFDNDSLVNIQSDDGEQNDAQSKFNQSEHLNKKINENTFDIRKKQDNVYKCFNTNNNINIYDQNQSAQSKTQKNSQSNSSASNNKYIDKDKINGIDLLDNDSSKNNKSINNNISLLKIPKSQENDDIGDQTLNNFNSTSRVLLDRHEDIIDNKQNQNYRDKQNISHVTYTGEIENDDAHFTLQ